MNIILFAIEIIGWRNSSTVVSDHIGAIAAFNTGIKESDSWCFTKHMNWNKYQTHTSSFSQTMGQLLDLDNPFEMNHKVI